MTALGEVSASGPSRRRAAVSFGRRLRLTSGPQRHLLALATAGAVVALTSFARSEFLAAAPETLPLLAWSAYAWVQVAFVLALAILSDAHTTRRRARRNDPGAVLLTTLVLVVACASLVAVVLAVHSAHALQGRTRWTHLGLAMNSLVASWWLIQCAFALRYARLHYRPNAAGAHEGGLVFPGAREPDYLDFVYQATVIGMTSQTSDVSITTRGMRALTLAHGALSFAFNLAVLALAINVLASALT